ncbi:MAG TPA: hypothetical protein PKK11_07730 [Methanothrix sp.]|nr:hypothetical protein [Methanothrix sp.]HPT19238.1 hypothetical protein [Methanothrix sp.]
MELKMNPISEREIRDLEERAAYLKGEKARALREEVASALSRAEADLANPDLIDRLDALLINVTQAGRDVCTNTRCPHYNKKCKMR